MNLTPIHVRGKRKPPKTNPPAALGTKPSSAGKAKRSLVTVLATRESRHRSTLESLPTEILENILLYSTNLSLPRASHFIGVKLSSKVTLLRLFIWVFHDTWNQWFGIPTDSTIVHGPPVKHPKLRTCDGDPILQSSLLELPRVDIDFILQAQQTWIDAYAKDRWYQHSVPWNDDPETVSHSHDGGFGHFDARACFEADYQQALTWTPFQVENLPWGTQDIHPMARLPIDLITGPWNDKQQRLLFWLARGGLRLDRVGRSLPPWEVKLACLQNAILAAEVPNALVANCLVQRWIFQGLPEDEVRRELKDLDRRLKWGGDPPEAKGMLRQTRGALDLFLQWPEYVGRSG